jgi:hypothetical protein
MNEFSLSHLVRLFFVIVVIVGAGEGIYYWWAHKK